MSTEQTLQDRSESKCELCSATNNLNVYEVAPTSDGSADQAILICSTCEDQINNPDNIVRDDAGSFIDDGFIDDMTVTISGSVSNDGTFTIDTGGVSANTLTLIATDTIVVESGTGGVSISGAASPDNPIPAVITDDASSMDEIDTPTDVTPFTVGYSNATSVTFSTTIIGVDVIAAYPGSTTKTITSAGLYTNMTPELVFAYKRYPQKSISSLINIDISWTIQY